MLTVEVGTLAEVEKQVVKAVLLYYRGNKARAAAHLGISRSALYSKLERHELAELVVDKPRCNYVEDIENEPHRCKLFRGHVETHQLR